MSGIKIVINPLNGRLEGVELNGISNDVEGQKYLFSVYQVLMGEIHQFAQKTAHKVQINRALGNLEEPSLQLKGGPDWGESIVILRE